MEIKVNDYVRTDNGYITKIIDFKEHYTKGKRLGLKEEVIENYLSLDNKHCEIIESIDYSIPPCYPSDEELEKIKNHIIKSSPQIIDLIEVGDVIRVFSDLHDLLGNELFEIRDEQHLKHLKNGFNEGYFHLISIVTKEMFEQMEYKIN